MQLLRLQMPMRLIKNDWRELKVTEEKNRKCKVCGKEISEQDFFHAESVKISLRLENELNLFPTFVLS